MRYRHCTALINIERARRFTYMEMHQLSNKVSHFLMNRFGLGQGESYAILLENEHVGLFHPWMFKCPVTAVWLDIRESRQMQLSQIDYVAPRLVFIERSLLPELLIPLTERGLIIVAMDPPHDEHPDVYYFWDLIGESRDANVEAELEFNDTDKHIALIRFTGGTTDKAKCAAYSLSNLWTWGMNPSHYMHTLPFPSPRGMFFSPINHAASGSLIIPIFTKGGTILTLNVTDPEQIGRMIEERNVQIIYAVPTVLYRMLDLGVCRRYDMSSLETVRYGAAPISPSKLEELLAQLGNVFVQGYGSSECWPSAAILAREDHALGSQNTIKRLNSVGQAVPGEELIICDEGGTELSANQSGEIFIRGANTIKGYYRAPELSRQHFTPTGFWKSGDIGYVDDEGYLYLVDRKKDMIISGGYNVYASEVEKCFNSHPNVENAAVVGLPDETWGEAVHAMIVLKMERSATEEELIAFCKQNMARYKVPKAIVIVDELPLSPAGKVLRREARQQLQLKYEKT
jgi:acyl-CoA synthetase (AMP-forming)/AMP-acid ligase II